MDNVEFDAVLQETLATVSDILGVKADEYATDVDRLHNFKKAALLVGCSPHQALGGFLVKHLVSVYDMLESLDSFPMARWDEKIFDSINYLILLRAILIEDSDSGHTGFVSDPKFGELSERLQKAQSHLRSSDSVHQDGSVQGLQRQAAQPAGDSEPD